MKRLYKILLLATMVGATPFQSFASAGVWVDYARIAKEQRITASATDGYKGLYDLTFDDVSAQIDKNIRYFATPSAYREYVDAIKGSGLADDITKNQLVVQNRVIGKPELTETGGVLFVSFDAEQKLIAYNAVTTKCVHIDVLLTENQGTNLRSSEFSFIGSPRLADSSACD